MTRVPQLTRSEVIFGHTKQMLHLARLSMETFGQRVVELYHERVPVQARQIQFLSEGDPFKVAKANAQKLDRYMDAAINSRLPVDLEESWVLALREPHRSECVADLARGYGLLAVPIPCGPGAVTDVQALVAMTDGFGRAMQSLAPALDDGAITSADAHHLPQAIEGANHLIAAVMAVRVRLEAVQGAAGHRA